MDALTNSPFNEKASLATGPEKHALEEGNLTDKEQAYKKQKLHQSSDNLKTTKKEKGIFDLSRILNDTAYRNNFLSGTNAFLHGLATVTNFIGKKNPILKGVNHIVDTSAFFCTRWLTPYISYGHAAYTAMANQREPILSFIKLIPPALFPIVGDANIDMVYGTSTSLNFPYDLVKNRLKEKINDSNSGFVNKIVEARKSHIAFAKIVLKEAGSMISDFFHGKADFWKEGIFVTNCIISLLGSVPMLIFGRDVRDTTFAKISGVLRNIGGIMGDVGWVFGGKVEKTKVIMGIIYSLASIADMAKRFVGEDVARVLIHLSAALNVTAMTMWNTLNTDEEKPLDKLITEKMQAKQKTEMQEELLVNRAKPQEISKNIDAEKPSYDMAL